MSCVLVEALLCKTLGVVCRLNLHSLCLPVHSPQSRRKRTSEGLPAASMIILQPRSGAYPKLVY
eukprot:3608082-Amphidinium_carterae.1